MSASGLVDWIREAFRTLARGFWALVALLFDLMSDLGAFGAGLVVVLLALFAVILAKLMQRRLVRKLRQDPKEELSYLRQEMWFFLPSWLVLPFYLLGKALAALGRWIARLFRRRKKEEEGEETSKKPAKAPFLAASLGPSFLIAGILSALLYVLARLSEPLLRARLDLTPGASVWQYLFLGHRPELAPYLPLDRTPYFAGALVVFLWITIWWWVARGVRLVYWKHLKRSLHEERDHWQVLQPWREWFAVEDLVRPASPYQRWAGTLLGVASPLVAWAWLSIASVPYRLTASEMAVALVVWLGWGIHLLLRGDEYRDPEEEVIKETLPEAERLPGWPAVLADLEEHHQVRPPRPFQPDRPMGKRPWVDLVTGDSLLSPFLTELLPEGGRLTSMQSKELRRLARLGHVHTRPAPPPGELTLGEPLTGEDDDSVRERNRIVLAPEGAGKTTLAVLAAANHALVHTRTTLVVTRDEARADAVTRRLRDRLDRSTLRWNLRLRQAGGDLAGDLAKGILPDVVVTSLHHLVVNILDQMGSYEPFLRNLGLIVVDDIETFAGSVETHAQLAFRRLTLTARKMLGVDQLGEESAPLILVLGTESMHRMPTWAAALCGIEAETRRYPHTPEKPKEEQKAGEAEIQHFYRLRDFHTATGEHLDLAEIIAACERRGVPWHYRYCRDGWRHLGRKSLPLTDEPEYFSSDPLDAVAVFLEGSWSEVGRELSRLVLAGSRSGRGPCAFITLVDPDEEMAFTQRDDSLELARELAILPRPVLRPPTGRTIHAHLASDLVQTWSEVGDVLTAFGNASALKLRQLSREGLLLTEERTDIHKDVQEYEPKVWVRALATAVAEDDEAEDRVGRTDSPLPSKVAQVDLPAGRIVPVLDRTDLSVLDRLEAASADFLYYPGRIFANAEGRYLVVHRASQEGREQRDGKGTASSGAVLAEPLVTDDVSSPRCSSSVRVIDTGDGPVEGYELAETTTTGHAFSGPDPVLIGEHPIHVSLARVEVTRQHLATLRLGPVFAEVRQRRIFDAESRRRFGRAQLDTVALGIFPNPPFEAEGHEDEPSDEEPPVLRLEPARLIAAALRLVLPSFYRGSAESVDIALQVNAETLEASASQSDPELGRVLGPDEGFFLFDLNLWGNGAARALHRDGVEMLLRLTRLVIERVLYHDRMRALYDHWGTENNPAGDWAPEDPKKSPRERLRARREYDEKVRHSALEWLDSRLRPEGTPAAAADVLGQYGSACEVGEGDFFDIGRCWWSQSETVTDLLWAKHRWRIEIGSEAMIDVAFDRDTAEEARNLTTDSALLEPGREAYRKYFEGSAKAGDAGGLDHGRPRGVWGPPGKDDKPQSSQVGADDEARKYQETACALAVYSWGPLGPLAGKLGAEAEKAENAYFQHPRLQRAHYLARFVQGIPTFRREPSGQWTPIETLLYRQGNSHAKSLLLALLLKRCGIEAGLFVSFSQKRALVAAAVPDSETGSPAIQTVRRDEHGRFATDEEAVGRPEQYQRGYKSAQLQFEHLEAWRKTDWRGIGARYLNEPVPLWGEQPQRQPDEEGSVEAVDLYVPIETLAGWPVGTASVGEIGDWIFLPLSAAWKKVLPEEDEEDEEPLAVPTFDLEPGEPGEEEADETEVRASEDLTETDEIEGEHDEEEAP